MSEEKELASRRNAIKATITGVIAGACGLLLPRKAEAQQDLKLYAMWVHGHNVQLERYTAPEKDKIVGKFKEYDGDIVSLGGAGCVACMRVGWAAKFTVYDCGTKNLPKSGSFWCHYAIPTPVIESGRRARAATLLIDYEASNNTRFGIRKIHVWNGNIRIAANDHPATANSEHNGGIPGNRAGGPPPNTDRLLRLNLGRKEVYFGIGVSIQIAAQRSIGDILDIRSVGVDFLI